MVWPALKRLLPAVLWLVVQARPAQAEAFGRWQLQPRSCTLEQRGSRPLRCQALQLDQRNADVVRLILQANGPGRGELIQLTLVGSLASGSEPMSCRSGSCSLQHPQQLALISLSLARFDGRGLARTLPSTWPVQGQCQITASTLDCKASAAQAADAPEWSVEAQLR